MLRFGSNIKYSDTVNGQTDGSTPSMSSQCISLSMAMLGMLTKHLSPGFHQSPNVKLPTSIPLSQKDTNQQKGNILLNHSNPF